MGKLIRSFFYPVKITHLKLSRSSSVYTLAMKQLGLSVIFILLAGCGNNTSGRNRTSPVIDPVQARPLEVTQKETVTFLRQQQMVSRFDCQGILTSRKYETVNSLSKKITINYEYRKKAWDYSVYNRRTKSSQKGPFTTDGRFVTDYAPTVFNMHVKKGINDVEYVFYRCTKITVAPNDEKTCTGTIELEKEGIVQLDVYYTSETLNGEQFIKPSPENCRPKK